MYTFKHTHICTCVLLSMHMHACIFTCCRSRRRRLHNKHMHTGFLMFSLFTSSGKCWARKHIGQTCKGSRVGGLVQQIRELGSHRLNQPSHGTSCIRFVAILTNVAILDSCNIVVVVSNEFIITYLKCLGKYLTKTAFVNSHTKLLINGVCFSH